MDVDLDLRGLTAADIPAWHRLLTAAERVDGTGEHYSPDDLAEEMANPDIDPSRDIMGAFVGGEMVGYFSVCPRSAAPPAHRLILEGCVAPEHRHRGVGTRMAEAMRARALELHRERQPGLEAVLTARGLSRNLDQERLLAGIGLTPERWTFGMRADLTAVAAPRPAPEGLEIRRYDDSFAGAMHEAHNAAFLDHPNFAPWTETMWKQWVTESRSFRPALSFVALHPQAPARVAAYLQTNEYDAHEAVTGRREAYVAKVGTRREHRGRGLAACLLGHALAAYAADGYDEASLDVDSENPSGALGIYERAGFAVESRWTDYSCRVPAGRGLP